LEIMDNESLLENVTKCESMLFNKLKNIESIKEIRGQGLMIAAEFDFPIQNLRKKLVEEYQVFTGASTHKNVLRLLPPLSIGEYEIDLFIEKLNKALKQL